MAWRAADSLFLSSLDVTHQIGSLWQNSVRRNGWNHPWRNRISKRIVTHFISKMKELPYMLLHYYCKVPTLHVLHHTFNWSCKCGIKFILNRKKHTSPHTHTPTQIVVSPQLKSVAIPQSDNSTWISTKLKKIDCYVAFKQNFWISWVFDWKFFEWFLNTQSSKCCVFLHKIKNLKNI